MTYNPSDDVEVVVPDYFFTIQKLLQQAGVFLIDLDSGEVIDGQVNLARIGLFDGLKNRPAKRKMGFLQPKDDTVFQYNGEDVEAILEPQGILEHEGPDGNPDYEQHFFTIKVVDANDVQKWQDLAVWICSKMVVEEDAHAPVFFNVIGLCLPDNKNPKSAKNAVLRKLQRFGLDNHED